MEDYFLLGIYTVITIVAIVFLSFSMGKDAGEAHICNEVSKAIEYNTISEESEIILNKICSYEKN